MKLMKHTILLMAGLLLVVPAQGQFDRDIPLLRPEEKRELDLQSADFNGAITPLLADAAKSTVRVWLGNRRLSYGTVIGEGDKVLTKWSEVAAAKDRMLTLDTSDGVSRGAKVTGVYEDEDLAVLTISGDPLPAVEWSMEPPALGRFLAAPQPDGRLAGFGVVSVLERNLRETDQAYLGVVGAMGFAGPGVKIGQVEPTAGAAKAGLKEGDVILRVGDRPISGLLELRNALIGREPGSTVEMVFRRGSEEMRADVLLGSRPALPRFSGDRLRQMERMGGAISRVRTNFTRAVQTDMRLRPDQVGGPVVDLQGRVLGVTLARGDRTRSFVMPAAAILEMLDRESVAPELAKVATGTETEGRRVLVRQGAVPRQREAGPSQERMRRHLQDMQRLMERMDEEMEALESNR